MIEIQCNRPDYEYDLHALTCSFFPQQEIVFTNMTGSVNSNAKNDQQLAKTVNLQIEIHIFELKDELKNGATLKISDTTEHNVIEKDLYLDKNEPKVKNKFKVFYYDALSEFTHTTLPWGNLTGIRPTKLAMQMIEQQEETDHIVKVLKKEHRVSEEKIRLSIEIAERERKILQLESVRNGYSIYIGIPFCPSTCLYCSFTSYPIAKYESMVWDYLKAMEKELDYWAAEYRDKKLSSVYIGGGTPTTLTAEQMDWLISKVKSKFNFDNVLEFTVEAGRADSITKEKLQVLINQEVTRISVNPQTMNDETLKLIGRHHSVEDVKRAFSMAREIGFNNINMDIILGLPGEEMQQVQHTLEEIAKLNPDSLTVHSLAIKRASALNRMIAEKGYVRMNNTDETMVLAAKTAADMKMVPYYLYRQKNMAGNFENVGYARDEKYGIYNILIMEEKQTIAAIGAGSITKLVLPDGRMERADNVKDVSLYITQIDEMIDRKRRLLALEKQF